MDLTNLAGLSDHLKRLIEVVSDGIENVSKPDLIRKTAEEKSYEIRTIANAVAESQKLLGDIVTCLEISGPSEILEDRSQQLGINEQEPTQRRIGRPDLAGGGHESAT